MKQDVRRELIKHYLNQAGRVDERRLEYGRKRRRMVSAGIAQWRNKDKIAVVDYENKMLAFEREAFAREMGGHV